MGWDSRRCSAADRPRTGCPGPRHRRGPRVQPPADETENRCAEEEGTRAATNARRSSTVDDVVGSRLSSQLATWLAFVAACCARSVATPEPWGRPSSRAHRRGTADRAGRAPLLARRLVGEPGPGLGVEVPWRGPCGLSPATRLAWSVAVEATCCALSFASLATEATFVLGDVRVWVSSSRSRVSFHGAGVGSWLVRSSAGCRVLAG